MCVNLVFYSLLPYRRPSAIVCDREKKVEKQKTKQTHDFVGAVYEYE